jgi:hypothetical protein
MDLKVIDNFLPEQLFLELVNAVTANYQQWFFLPTPTGFETISEKHYAFGCDVVRLSKPGVYNPTIASSKYIKLLNDQVKKECGFRSVVRSRLDMTTYRGEQVTFHPHIDVAFEHYTSIFYLIECDAPTIIYNQKHYTNDPIDISSLTVMQEIMPKQNRIVIFDGNHIHTGTSALDVPRRILVNSNYI